MRARSLSLAAATTAASAIVTALFTGGAAAQTTTVNGSSLVLKSANSNIINTNGYVGTYITLAAPGTVSLSVNAVAASGAAAAPHMNIVVDDSSSGFNVGTTSSNYASSVFLPAGTHFIRTELNNYAGRSLTVNSLTVGGATVANTNTDANALASADTYIQNFRKGDATVALSGPGNIPLLKGTPVNVDLARIGFNFGTAVPGVNASNISSYLGTNGTAQQTNYQQRLNQNFNAVTPENIGKWSSDEATRNVNTMTGVDTFLNYVQSHHMFARMHNVIWGSQQPTWVNTLLTQAGSGSMTAATDLRGEITERVGYYVGTGTASDRALKYGELDIYNESYHTGASLATTNDYWHVYGPSGVAGMYNEIASAVTASGANTKLFVNEYNVFQNQNDAYANWYARHLEQIRSAGGAVSGIGMQYYPGPTIGAGNTQHSPARIASVLQNLSVQGLPLALTEFGVGTSSDSTIPATILKDSMRLMFGSPNASGFYMWGFEAENGGGNMFQPGAALYTVNTADWNTWTITDSGKAWQDLLGIQDWDGNPNNAWTTHLAATVDASGRIGFNGFYGDYNIGNQSGFKNLMFAKGTNSYATSLAAPPDWHFWNAANSGSWSGASDWTNSAADGAGQTAYFGSAGSARAVTVDAPRTVGMIALDSAGTYTIGGAGTITLAGYTGANAAAVYVATGSHAIDAPVLPTDDTTITVAPATSTLAISNLRPSSVTLTKAGAGTVAVNNVRAGALDVEAGTVAILGGRSQGRTSRFGSLTVASGAALNLAEQDLIVDYGGASPLGTIKSLIVSGYNGGSWNGDGINSSAAPGGFNGHATALGYAEADSVLGASGGTFSGQAIDGTTVLVRYTLAGDTNLDGAVDLTDFTFLASSFNQSAGASWLNGDFNYDGAVNLTDFTFLASNFNAALPDEVALGATVPEPSTTCIVLPGIGVGLIARRRRLKNPTAA